MNLTDLTSFVAVVDHGTITGAARSEEVPKSTISRRIARLEASLGVQLLVRSSRSFSVTDDGLLLHARAKGALQELQDIRAVLMEGTDEPRGTLVVSAPRDVARANFFAALLAVYRAKYPAVALDVRLESRYVDLVGDGVDVALRGHGAEVPGDPRLMTKLLGRPSAGFYASRAYLRRCGTPRTLEDLDGHDLIVRRFAGQREVKVRSTSGERLIPLAGAMIQVNDFGLVHTLVTEGAGIALLPISAHNTAEFVRVLPAWSMRLGGISVVWPSSRFLAPKVRGFIDLAVQQLTAEWS